MNVQFAEPTLESLDALQSECLVLTSFVDDRPLRGLAGHVDWRLCGRLSGYMQADFVDLELGRALLLPLPGERIPQRLLLLVGMGRRAEFDGSRFDAVCAATFRHLAGLHQRSVAMALPGRIGLDVALRGAISGLGQALANHLPPESILALQLTLLEPTEVQRELGEPMRSLTRRLDDHARSMLGMEADAPVPAPDASERPTADQASRDWRRGLVRLPPAEPSEGLAGEL